MSLRCLRDSDEIPPEYESFFDAMEVSREEHKKSQDHVLITMALLISPCVFPLFDAKEDVPFCIDHGTTIEKISVMKNTSSPLDDDLVLTLQIICGPSCQDPHSSRHCDEKSWTITGPVLNNLCGVDIFDSREHDGCIFHLSLERGKLCDQDDVLVVARTYNPKNNVEYRPISSLELKTKRHARWVQSFKEKWEFDRNN